MIVPVYNPDTSDLEKSYLSSYAQEGSTTLILKNTDRFVDEHPILIGRMSDERSEIKMVDSINVDDVTITVDATDFPHDADDPVFVLRYDKVRFYRKNGLAGTPVLMATVSVDVDNEDDLTKWEDPDTLDSHFYVTTYYNSVTEEESEYSDPIQATGFTSTTAGNIIDQVVRRVRDTSFNVLTIQEYLDIMNEVGSDLITQAHRPYRFLKRTVFLNTVADQNYIQMPENLWKFNHLFTSVNSGNYSRFNEVTPISEEQWNNRYDNNQTSAQNNILDVAIEEETNRLLIAPTPLTGESDVVKLSYYKTFDEITSVGSPVETPNNLIYRYKLMAEYYSAKSETDNQWARLAEKYENKYGNEIVKMQRVNRLDTGTPRSMMPKRYYKRRRYHL